MLLWLRKIFFYLFVALYFMVTPYAIMYAMGYIFYPAEGELLRTGLLAITTYPKNATVFIEGRKYSKKTPATVRDMLPGLYQVRISNKGYNTWQKQIEILPEKATKLDPVVLWPERPREEMVSERSYRDFLPAIIDSKIFAWDNKSLESLREIDLFFNKETNIGARIEGAKEMRIRSFILPKGSQTVLFRVDRKDKHGFLFYDLAKEKTVAYFEKEIPEDAYVDWDPKNPDDIFFITKGVLYRFDLGSKKGAPVEIMRDLQGFGVKHNRLHLLKNDYTVLQTRRDGLHPETILDPSGNSKEIFAGSKGSFYKIQIFKRDFFQRDMLFFWSNQGALITNWLPYVLANQGVLGLGYATTSDDEKIFYWTKTNIGVVDFTKDTGSLFEKGPSQLLLYESGEDIEQVFWAYDDTHLVFLDRNSVKLLEASGDEPYLAREIARVAADSRIFYDDRQHVLYFLEPETHRLMKRQLVEP